MTNPRPGSARWHSRVRRAAGGIAAVRSARNLNESSAPRWFARSWRFKLQAPTSREPRPGSARWQSRIRRAARGIAAVRSARNLTVSIAPRWFARSWRSKLQAPTSRELRPGNARHATRTAPNGFLRQLCCLFSHFARLCLLSSCNESRCPPHRRDLTM